MTKLFDTDCELDYRVQTPSTFVLKIEAAFSDAQDIQSESLDIEPPRRVERASDALGNRTLRVNVLPGPFSVRYRATVGLHPLRSALTLRE